MSVNSLFLRDWIEALRPVHGRLTIPIAAIFEDRSRPEGVRSLATDILTDYASDDVNRLAELLMVAEPKAYVSLFPLAEKKSEQILPLFQAELAKKATYSWNDPPPNPARTEPDAFLVSRIEAAQGMLVERFAFCQTMPLDEFLTTAESLRKSEYRPVRFRPYADEHLVRVAAVWTRDGRPWRICSGLTNDEVRQQDERNEKDKFLPVDVAGYLVTGKDGQPAGRYAALWVEKSSVDDARMYVGITADDETEVRAKLKDEKRISRTLHAIVGPDGRMRYSGIWGRPPAPTVEGQAHRDLFERNFEQNQADLGDQLLIDVVVGGASKPRSIRDESRRPRVRGQESEVEARRSRLTAVSSVGEYPAGRESEGTRRSSARDREGPGIHPRQTVPGHRPRPAG